MLNATMLDMLEFMGKFKNRLGDNAVAEWFVTGKCLVVRVWFSLGGQHHQTERTWTQNELMEQPFLQEQLDELVARVIGEVERLRSTHE